MELPSYCQLASQLSYRRNGRFVTKAHINWLEIFQPDIVLLSGFSVPANYLAYKWAKKNRRRVIVLTEVSRYNSGALRTAVWQWKLLRRLYYEVDMIFAVTQEAFIQFRDVFGFGKKVRLARYAADIDTYLEHPLRQTRPDLRILFANRLIEPYNPLQALEIFRRVQEQLPECGMALNGAGHLRNICEEIIRKLDLRSVFFLDGIQRWEDLDDIYRKSDVHLFPAVSSTGNLSLYETMASGMGLVISDQIQGNGMLIENEINGFRLPLNEAAMTKAIIDYATVPDLLSTHGYLNKKIAQPFGPTGTARLYHDLIQSIL